MGIRFYFLRKRARDRESAERIFHRLEKERLSLHEKIDRGIASGASFDHMISLRHKDDAYDEILHELASRAGINYDETAIGRYMLQVEKEFERERMELEAGMDDYSIP
jgi:hypothetical protein